MSAPWCFHSIFWECLFVFGAGISWFIVQIGRSDNEVADVLARLGSDGFNFVEFASVFCLVGLISLLSFIPYFLIDNNKNNLLVLKK